MRHAWVWLLTVTLTSCPSSAPPAARSTAEPAPSVAPEESPPPDSPKPVNVLVIVTDDQRADQTLAVMPNTRRFLRRQGTTFTHAFTTTPLCCPARASLLTGRYAHNHEVLTNYDPTPLRPGTTIVRYLHDAGYRTAIAGKYLNSWPLTRDPPYFDLWAIEDAYEYYGSTFNLQGKLVRVDRYSTDFIRRRALQTLQRFENIDARPWFLYVAPLAAHEPFTPAERHVDAKVPPTSPTPAVTRSSSGKPPFALRSRRSFGWTHALARRQLRTLKSVDELVGAVFARMRRFDEARDTFVVFLSDNGYLWGEFGLTEKRVPYSPAIRIPLIARWPGHIGRGERDGRLVANIDVAPTILDAVGIPYRDGLFDGRSLLDESRRKRLLLEYFKDPKIAVPEWSSIRTRRYQYVEYYGTGGEISFREYYDLAQDPWQRRNLLGGKGLDRRVVAAIHRRLDRDRRCRGVSCP